MSATAPIRASTSRPAPTMSLRLGSMPPPLRPSDSERVLQRPTFAPELRGPQGRPQGAHVCPNAAGGRRARPRSGDRSPSPDSPTAMHGSGLPIRFATRSPGRTCRSTSGSRTAGPVHDSRDAKSGPAVLPAPEEAAGRSGRGWMAGSRARGSQIEHMFYTS
jgi:hypothetical protein